MSRKTGKNKSFFVVTGTMVSAIAIGLGAYHKFYDPTKSMCLFSDVLTLFYGYETALQHQMKDLENYDITYTSNGRQMHCKVEIVSYVEAEPYYIVPNDFTVTQDDTGKVIGYKEVIVAKNETTGDVVLPTSEYILLDDGNVKVEYKAPDGYTLVKDIETIEPKIVFGGSDKVIFEYILSKNDELNIYSQSWSYVGGKFITQHETLSLTLENNIQ